MQLLKQLVTSLLNAAVRSHIKRNKIQIIGVAGSVGKTSATNAIRIVLAEKYQVHQPKTTYNTRRSVHVEMFDLPFATSTVGWARASLRVLAKSFGRSSYQVLVVELGTDYPGELREFAWLQPHIGVLTAIAPEHMEYFKTIEAVAEEELSIAKYCDRLIFNANTVDKKFVPAGLEKRTVWYGKGTDFDASNYELKADGATVDLLYDGQKFPKIAVQMIGDHSLNALLAAAAVGQACGLSSDEAIAGIQKAAPVKGRMQLLPGIRSAKLIDDSYNSSPEAAKAALDVLYGLKVSQRVAVLGMMNEMGDYSERAHRETGAYCDPKKLDLVLTVGADANRYLADEAESKGCKVERFDSPYKAGDFLEQQLQEGAAVLFKGSQNGVFTEEAIKSVLADPADQNKLVRQSDFWMNRKAAQFPEA